MYARHHHYSFYGTCLQTNSALPLLAPWTESQAAAIRLHQLDSTAPPSVEQCCWTPIRYTTKLYPFLDLDRATCPGCATPWVRIRFRSPINDHWTAFWIDERTSEIWVAQRSDSQALGIMTLLVNAPASILMTIRGHLCLHAGAVAGPAGALLLVGPEGAGKSTTAATLVQHGYTILADDVGVIRREGEVDVVGAGMTALSLTNTMSKDFADQPLIRLPYPPPYEDKWLLPATRPAPPTTPLAALLLLQPRRVGESPALTRLAPGDALVQLSAHLSAQWLSEEVHRRSFVRLAELVRRTPAFAVQAGDDITQLPALVDAIDATVASSVDAATSPAHG